MKSHEPVDVFGSLPSSTMFVSVSDIDAEPANVSFVVPGRFVTSRSDAPIAATRVTVAGESLRQAPARLRSRGLQQMLATLPGWADEDNGLLHVRGVDDGFLYVEDGVPVYDRVDTLFGIAPDPSAIESINVMTGYVPPQYGLKSGAVIEVQTAAARRSEESRAGA